MAILKLTLRFIAIMLLGLGLIVGGVTLYVSAPIAAPESAPGRWPAASANAWYGQQPWLVGANYNPATASNELEMWQAATFDPATIDKELAWAEAMGLNTMRVFLHDLAYEQDPAGFRQRLDQFLSICQRHRIRPMLVLFDSCWDPNPQLGPQRAPVPGVHNSRWVQSPGAAALRDPSQYPRLRAYVTGVVGAFRDDPRVLLWDIWNEPSNTNVLSYGKLEPDNKLALVIELLPQAFQWARSARPRQPLTAAVWEWGLTNWAQPARARVLERLQLANSDVISFHNYSKEKAFARRVAELQEMGRPVICTEFMARGVGSRFRNPPARREARKGGHVLLGLRGGPHPNLPALGQLDEALRQRPRAGRVVPRNPAPRRLPLPPQRSHPD